MVGIRSPSGEEAELARYLAATLPDWGLETSIDAAGNVIARRGRPDAPTILLMGHMDTVPDELPVRQEGTVLYGRGCVDAKGPLATMICAASAADVGDVQIVVAGAVEEEAFGRGAQEIADAFAPDVAFIGEPNGWAGVGIGYKGRILLDYEVSCPAAHTSSPDEKATEAAIGFWNAVSDYCEHIGTGRSAFDRPIPTLVEMRGMIERARLTVSCRTPPGFDDAAFERVAAAAAGDARLTIRDRTIPVRLDPTNLAVRSLCAAIRGHSVRPKLKLKTGTADLNIVAPHWAVPLAVYGPGDSGLDHTDREHIDLVEYSRAIDVLREAIERVAADLGRTDAAKPRRPTTPNPGWDT
jgi:LysW-gamma-L-lysine carboxypeptidase